MTAQFAHTIQAVNQKGIDNGQSAGRILRGARTLPRGGRSGDRGIFGCSVAQGKAEMGADCGGAAAVAGVVRFHGDKAPDGDNLCPDWFYLSASGNWQLPEWRRVFDYRSRVKAGARSGLE